MGDESSFLTLEGFDHLYSFFTSRVDSALVKDILDKILESADGGNYRAITKNKKTKALRKSEQINSMIGMLHSMCESPRHILEIGSATGRMAVEIADRMEYSRIVGVEIKRDNVLRARKNAEERSNLSFIEANAFSFNPEEKPDITLCLHGCGALTDRVADIAVLNSSALLCAPCCYGVLRKENNQEGNYHLPRSSTLKKREEAFDSLIKRAANIEGAHKDSRLNAREIYRELTLTLLNFDRIFYLQEKGFWAGLGRLTPSGGPLGERSYINSPHSIIIKGMPPQT